MRALLLAAAGLVVAVALQELVAIAAPLLQLTVRPAAFALAPADVEVRLRVEPGGRGREVLLELAGSSGFYRSSVFPIRSDPDAPTVQPPASYRALPAGDYVVVATLSDCSRTGCGRRIQLARVEREVHLLDGASGGTR